MSLFNSAPVAISIYSLFLTLVSVLVFFAAAEVYHKEIPWAAPAASLLTFPPAFILFYLAVIDRYLPIDAEIMPLAAFLFWGGNVFAVLFGVMGLRDIHTQFEEPVGRRYAWIGILLGFLFPFFLTHAVAANVIQRFPYETSKALEERFKNEKPPDPSTAAVPEAGNSAPDDVWNFFMSAAPSAGGAGGSTGPAVETYSGAASYDPYAGVFSSDFESPLYGYKMRIKNSSWQPWETLADNVPLAEFGMAQDRTAVFVMPFFLAGHEPPLDLLAQAALSFLNLDFQTLPASALKKISPDNFQGYGFEHEYQNSAGRIYQRGQILKGRDRAYFIASVQNLTDGPRQPEMHESAHRSFEMTQQKTIDSSRFNEKDKERNAQLLDRIGNLYFSRGNGEEALRYMKSAHEMKPDHGPIFEDYLAMLINTGKFEEAHQAIQKKTGAFSGQKNLPILEARVLHEVGKNPEALKKLEEVLQSDPQNTIALQFYADILWKMERREEALKLLKEHVTNSGDADLRLLYVGFLAQNDQADTAIEEARKIHQDLPHHQVARKALFDLLQSHGKYDELLSLVRQEIDSGQADYQSYVYAGLSQAGLSQYKDAHQSFQQAHRMNAADLATKQYMEELEKLLGYGNLEEVKKPIEPLPVPAGLMPAEDKSGKNPFKGNPSYYLAHIFVLHFEAGAPLRSTEYRKIKVTNPNDLNRFNEFTLKYSSSLEQIYVNRLEVRDEKGKVKGSLDPSKLYIVDDSDAGFASHDKILHVPVPGVTVGSTIELVFSKRHKALSDAMPYEEFPFAAFFPVLKQQVIVTGQTQKVTAAALNGVRYQEKPGVKIWHADRLPAIKPVDHLPEYDQFIPVVKIGSKEANWIGVGDEYLKMVKNLIEVEPEIRELAQKITAGAQTPEEKAERLYRHVQDEYSYNAIEFGLRAMIPQEASKIASQKYGDCKDHSLLFYQLLQASQIPAHLMLVRSNGRVEENLPHLEQFDHMIVYCPLYAKNPFLDTTAKNLSESIPPAALLRKKGLVLEPGRSRLMELKAGAGAEVRVLAERTVSLEGHDVEVKEKAVTHGYAAEMFRTFFREIPEHLHVQQFQEHFMASSRYGLKNIRTENLTDRSKPFVIDLEYRVSNVLYDVGANRVGQLPSFWEEFFMEMRHDDERAAPFEFIYPTVVQTKSHFTYPGFEFEKQSLASPLNRTDPFAVLTGRMEPVADGLRLETLTERKQGVFPASDYAAAQSGIKEILNALRAKIVLTQKR